jgi:hypothetical protein
MFPIKRDFDLLALAGIKIAYKVASGMISISSSRSATYLIIGTLYQFFAVICGEVAPLLSN